jgi:phosphoribosylamine--glycine ligase
MRPGASVCIIAASGGYPGRYASGKVITGLPGADERAEDVVIFHSGTAVKDGQTVTAGGRVLAVTAVAADLGTALGKAYAELEKVSFEGMQFRRDIAYRALRQEKA